MFSTLWQQDVVKLKMEVFILCFGQSGKLSGLTPPWHLGPKCKENAHVCARCLKAAFHAA